MKAFRLMAALLALLLVLAACGTDGGASPTAGDDTDETTPPATGTDAGAGDDSADWPDELVIGFVPSREADALVTTIQPVADYLSDYLSEQAGKEITVDGYVSTDYTGLVTAMQTGQAHIGAFGPFAMLQAVDQADAEIILQSERFGSGTYHTQFFTNQPDRYCEDEPVENTRVVEDEEVTFLNCNGTDRENEDTPEGPIGITALDNLEEGTTVSFVEATSASGYIFPATVFAVAGFNPESDINPLFAGSHDASVIAVCQGQAEVGVSFDDARAVAVSECDIASEVVVFAYGPEIPNDGVAVSGDLPDNLKTAIQQGLIEYSESEEGAEVLDSIYNINAFTEPNLEAFEIVRDAVDQLGAGQ
jgi:phosphonate transport system substrate-binding protein